MIKLKKGDKIKIIAHDQFCDKDGCMGWDSDMDEYIGRVVTVEANCRGWVKIKEDDGDWNWSPCMFEVVESKPIFISYCYRLIIGNV